MKIQCRFISSAQNFFFFLLYEQFLLYKNKLEWFQHTLNILLKNSLKYWEQSFFKWSHCIWISGTNNSEIRSNKTRPIWPPLTQSLQQIQILISLCWAPCCVMTETLYLTIYTTMLCGFYLLYFGTICFDQKAVISRCGLCRNITKPLVKYDVTLCVQLPILISQTS